MQSRFHFRVMYNVGGGKLALYAPLPEGESGCARDPIGSTCQATNFPHIWVLPPTPDPSSGIPTCMHNIMLQHRHSERVQNWGGQSQFLGI